MYYAAKYNNRIFNGSKLKVWKNIEGEGNMLSYEFKKLFGKKKMIVLIIFFAVISMYSSAEMYKVQSLDFGVPFENYLNAHGVYRFAVLMIVMVAASSIFPNESENNMSEIMMTSRYGKNRIPLIKMSTILLTSNILFIISTLVIMLGYFWNFGTAFDIPITEGWELSYTIDPDIKTFGDKLLIEQISGFIEINFTALVCMLLSLKVKKAFSTVVFVVAAYLAIAVIPLSNVPVLFVLTDLSPMCLGGRVTTYKELFIVGSHSITALDIGFVLYIILVGLLAMRVKSVYKTK